MVHKYIICTSTTYCCLTCLVVDIKSKWYGEYPEPLTIPFAIAIYVLPEPKNGMSIAGNAPPIPAPSGATWIDNGIPAGRVIKPVEVLYAKSGTASSPLMNTSTTGLPQHQIVLVTSIRASGRGNSTNGPGVPVEAKSPNSAPLLLFVGSKKPEAITVTIAPSSASVDRGASNAACYSCTWKHLPAPEACNQVGSSK